MDTELNANLKDFHVLMKQVNDDLKKALISVLFLAMSKTCEQVFSLNGATTVSFTEEWLFSTLHIDDEYKSTLFFGLNYSGFQKALFKNKQLFEQDMNLVGLKCLNIDILCMSITFEPL